MGGGIRVDDIAQNDRALEGKVEELCGKPVDIDPETIGGPLVELIDPPVHAILVKIHSRNGAVTVSGKRKGNVVTGPNWGIGFVALTLEPGETYKVHGNPTLRFFRGRVS